MCSSSVEKRFGSYWEGPRKNTNEEQDEKPRCFMAEILFGCLLMPFPPTGCGVPMKFLPNNRSKYAPSGIVNGSSIRYRLVNDRKFDFHEQQAGGGTRYRTRHGCCRELQSDPPVCPCGELTVELSGPEIRAQILQSRIVNRQHDRFAPAGAMKQLQCCRDIGT